MPIAKAVKIRLKIILPGVNWCTAERLPNRTIIVQITPMHIIIFNKISSSYDTIWDKGIEINRQNMYGWSEYAVAHKISLNRPLPSINDATHQFAVTKTIKTPKVFSIDITKLYSMARFSLKINARKLQ